MRSSQKHEPGQIKQEGDPRSLESRDADANRKDFDLGSIVGSTPSNGGYENQGVLRSDLATTVPVFGKLKFHRKSASPSDFS